MRVWSNKYTDTHPHTLYVIFKKSEKTKKKIEWNENKLPEYVHSTEYTYISLNVNWKPTNPAFDVSFFSILVELYDYRSNMNTRSFFKKKKLEMITNSFKLN